MLGVLFWFPVFIISFYLNFALPETLVWGPAFLIPSTVLALAVSKSTSNMPTDQWYNEIVLCGVNKLSMSLTDVTSMSTKRKQWMPLFEAYFGITIKFVNPAVLTYLLMSNLTDDFDIPYGD